MSTIRSSREIEGVFRAGRRSAGPLVIVLMAETPSGRDPSGRVAFIAGKRLGNAVKRNRAKRLLRAAFREAGGPQAHRDILLIARPDLLDTVMGDVAASMRAQLSRMNARA
jgi:ribonuclease P protein component